VGGKDYGSVPEEIKPSKNAILIAKSLGSFMFF